MFYINGPIGEKSCYGFKAEKMYAKYLYRDEHSNIWHVSNCIFKGRGATFPLQSCFGLFIFMPEVEKYARKCDS